MNVARRLWITPLVLLATSVLAQQPALTTAPRKVTLHIEPQAVGDALSEFGRQTGLTVMIQSVVARGVTSPKLDGNFTLADALDKLLSHTGLHYEYLDAKTVAVLGPRIDAKIAARKTAASEAELVRESGPESDGPAAVGNDDNSGSRGTGNDNDTNAKGNKLAEVVITGTHIRGMSNDDSSVTVYSRADIKDSGVTTLEQFARKMPENFSSVDATASNFQNPTGGFAQDGMNAFAGTGFNLHGLGPGATLTLLDGHRLAPAGADGQFVDVSMIPLAAIDRIEVLADGASAVYGADAVAGVVNVVLRKDFSGGETSLRGSGTSSGGGTEREVSQLLGHKWQTGDAMVTYEHDDQGGIRSDQRSFIPDQGGSIYVVPKQTKDSVFFTARQDVIRDTQLSVDGFYSKRDFTQNLLFLGAPEDIEGRAEQYGGTFGVANNFAGDWHGEATETFSRINEFQNLTLPSFSTPGALQTQRPARQSRVSEFDLHADGSVFSLPAGPVRAAAGASYRTDDFNIAFSNTDAGVQTSSPEIALQRHVSSLYGEFLVPLVQALTRLELSLAARYDHYGDFGGTTNPKVALIWEVHPGFKIRGSYGTSFRAPPLTQLALSPFYEQVQMSDPSAPSGTTTTLINFTSGNLHLKPERSRSYSFGVDMKPESIPDISGSLNYFDINFKDRIAPPPFSSVDDLLSEPQLKSFITRNPDPTFIQSIYDSGDPILDLTGQGPTGVQAYVNLQPTNIAQNKETGAQFLFNYHTQIQKSSFGVVTNINYIFKNDYTVIPGVQPVSLLNDVYQPVKLRSRVSANWGYRGLESTFSINHTGSYRNTLFSPSTSVASWTTEDVLLAYSLMHGEARSPLHNLELMFGVQNITNKNPPGVSVPLTAVSNIGYDPANASPVGRAVELSASVVW